MSTSGQITVVSSREQKILNHLHGGMRTWAELRALTKMNDDNLGFAIGELLIQRKIWTGEKGDVRVYGIERRMGLVPRLATPQRRASDLHA